MGHPVRINGAEVAAALAARSREPFEHALARILEAEPSRATWRKFAEKHPDRWSQALATLARLAGYTDKTEAMNLNIYADLRSMSDVALQMHLAELQRQLSAQLEPTVPPP